MYSHKHNESHKNLHHLDLRQEEESPGNEVPGDAMRGKRGEVAARVDHVGMKAMSSGLVHSRGSCGECWS